MSEKVKHNEQLEGIFKYLNDSMSNTERYDFERDLERDPFTYEAFDGLSQLKRSEIESDLLALDVISGKKKKTNKVLKWISVAAVFIALISGSFYLYENFDSFSFQTAKNIDKNIPEKINEPLAFKKEVPMIVPVDTTRIMLAGVDSNSATQQPVPSKYGNTLASNTLTSGDKPGVKDSAKKRAIFKTPADVVPMMAAKKTEESVAEIVSVAADDKTQAAPAAEADKLLNEEVAMKEEAVKRPGANADPEPLGGSALYKTYLDKNVKYPVSVEKPQRETVRVRFKISKTGVPTNIQVEKSPGEAFTNEAIRLIQNGPRWSPEIKDGIPVEGEASVKITFKP